MQTIAQNLISLRATDAKQRPFKIISLLACVAFAMSACTMPAQAPPAKDKDQAAVRRLEPEGDARGLLNKGQVLLQQGKTQEALDTLDELERRFGQDSRQSVQAILAQAHSLKAPFAPPPTEPLAAQSETGRRPGEATDPAQRKKLVTAMFNQAAILGKEGNLAEAIPIYREIEQTYDKDGDDKSWLLWAISYQGDLQRQMRNPKAAVAAYERLDKRFAQESDPTFKAVVADALSKKGETLAEQGNARAAIAAYEEIGRRYAEDRDAGFRQRAVRALSAKGMLLGKQGAGEEPDSETPNMNFRPTGDTAAAIAVYDDIVRRFGNDKDPNIRHDVGVTLLRKSEALRLAGNNQGTIDVYDEIVKRFGKDNAEGSRVLVATALFRKGLALGKQEGASNTAINTFDELIQRFANDTSPKVRKTVGQAVAAKQRLVTEMESPHDN
ncbi:MAG: tetratricopeptide repeat protein [Betaproteobacteria bacterium]|nr:tetratricopeptide repeat protein [Betaproteobacteria bacterium]